MRRKDREITNKDEILDIMKRCDSCTVAFFDKEYPYIIPLNFGVYYNDKFEIYFHCAKSGTKLSLLEANENVGFEMDCEHKLIIGDKSCDTTMEYESVCGNGVMSIVNNDEKVKGLNLIMEHYDQKAQHSFDEKAVEMIHILKLEVNEIVGKRLKR